jgi:hypothetical protein
MVIIPMATSVVLYASLSQLEVAVEDLPVVEVEAEVVQTKTSVTHK